MLVATLVLPAFFAAQGSLGAERRQDPRAYDTEFLLTDEVEIDVGEFRPLRPWFPLLRQRLIFSDLAVSNGEVALVRGDRMVVPAGAQFYRAISTVPVWCTANMRMPASEFSNVVIGRVYGQYCIVDEDGDGVFRHFFDRARTIEFLPAVRGRVPGNMREIRPIELTRVDPASLQSRYFVGLRYLRTTRGDRPVPIFQLFAGSEHGSVPIEQPFPGPPGDVEQADVGGALLQLSSQRESTSARVVRGFAAGPLRIRGTNCGIINGC